MNKFQGFAPMAACGLVAYQVCGTWSLALSCCCGPGHGSLALGWPPLSFSPLQSQLQAQSWALHCSFSGQTGLDSGLASQQVLVCPDE